MNICTRLLFILVLMSPPTFAEALPAVSNHVLATQIIYGTQPLILDVRTPEEFAAGHVPGAVNIPYDQIAGRYQEITQPKTAELVVYCRSGKRAAIAEQALLDLGFSAVVDLDGHWLGWSEASLNAETGTSD